MDAIGDEVEVGVVDATDDGAGGEVTARQGFFPVVRGEEVSLSQGFAGLVAASLPARRAARLNVLEAIATE